MKMFVLILTMIGVFAMTACSNSPDLAPPVTQSVGSSAVAPGEKPGAEDKSFLEKSAQNIGVRKGENGHLFVDGNADTQFLRLITYFNLEARGSQDEGVNRLYKISGFYSGGSFGENGYTDSVAYQIQISHDNFESLSDLTSLLKEGSLSLSPGGYLISKSNDPYEGLNAILTYRNREAITSGREYKLKGWYEAKQLEGKLISDSVYIIAQFSFEESIYPPFEDLALYTSNSSFGEQRQKAIVAQAAVEFSQILSMPSELAILAFDFSGDNGRGYSYAYLFEASDIAELNKVREGKIRFDVSEILSLAEVKRPAASYIIAGRIVSNSGLPKATDERTYEPISAESIEVVARIVSETSRVINPTNLEIVIHEFAGISPNDLTTWSYKFDKDDIAQIRDSELTAEEIVKKGTVIEQIWIIPGGRSIPPAKPLIK